MTLGSDLALFAKTISEDSEHGASHILKIAASSLHTSLKRNPDASPSEIHACVKEYALNLIRGQRQMASILNFSNRLLLELARHQGDKDIGNKIWKFAIEISRESSEALDRIAEESSNAIQGTRFLTHSRSSTLLHFLSKLHNRKRLTVYCTYSRPGGEGRLLSGELSVAGVYSELIEEAEAMRYLSECDALLIGADAIIPKGVVNKIGTYMLSLSARELAIPVFCLTDSTKFWPFNEPIEKSLRSEGTRPAHGRGLFEITPGNLITKIIFETGPTTFKELQFHSNAESIAPEIRKLIGN
jgi:translation initiation factor eIF-2B subunit delta